MRKPLTDTDSRDPAVAAVRAEVARRDRRLQDAAAVLGLHPSAFTRRMSGEVEFTIAELRKLAAWLEVPVTVLVAEPRLADAGFAQPTALGVAVLFLAAILLGVSTGPAVGLFAVAAILGGRLLFLVGRGVVDAERAAIARGRRD